MVVLAGWLSAFGANACIGQMWREAAPHLSRNLCRVLKSTKESCPMFEVIRNSDSVLYIHEAELSPKTENRGSRGTYTLCPVDGIMITCSLVRTRALVLAVI